ncbi:Signal transduction histidine kinase [Halorhabdus sp. SVX81]|uniref:sensor histidine kinase n=1 Tax=Halorhabdus sp. SVX81 TaxID=2978283 RepID=UPI0023D9E9D5|nr:HAMP domain-containing sensor histidine kinase [Halorhabdus sp. SVX81]WEL18980.1 Signal transduction histidine kinase [Halorhabdus sp. SVX81]
MTDNPTSIVDAEQWPDPVCHYGIEDGTPVVETVNEAFETTFGPVDAGEPVASLFETVGLSIVQGPDEPAVVGTAADQFTVETGTQPSESGAASHDRYLLRVVPTDGNAGGVLLFTPVPTGIARAADEIGLDHVASVISHDLRNPLDVAKARLRAARETGEVEHFEHVADAHDRMERIVGDVLTLARGADVVQPDGRVDISAAAERAWATVETDDADIVVEKSLPTVVADPDRLGRLFENLFRNSIEHGGTDVTVTVGPLADAPGFYVADDGRGIPPGRRERVFAPGFSTDDHGTGLGLSIVARIADHHGWSVAATDSASGGARFEITGLDTG